MSPAQHRQVRQFRLAAELPRHNVVTIRTRTPGARSQGVRIRGPGRPPPGVARRGWCGWPGRRRGAGPCRSARSAPPRRRSTASAATPGRAGPPKSRHPARARFSQVVEPDQHVDVRAVPTGVGQHRRRGVVEHVPHTSAAPRPAAPRAAGRPRRSAAWRGRRSPRRSRRTSRRRRTGPSPSRRPSGSRVRNSSFTRAGGPVVGLLAVLVQQLDQRRAPVLQLRRGVHIGLRRPAAPPHPPTPPARAARPACCARTRAITSTCRSPVPACREHLRGGRATAPATPPRPTRCAG